MQPRNIRFIDVIIHKTRLHCFFLAGTSAVYHGKLIGSVTTYYHNFRGTVYAAAAKSVVITDLNYDGGGPAAHFWAGSNSGLDPNGDQLLDEEMSTKVLKPYKNATVFLRLPRKITEYKSLGIYCELFGADFGNVQIPAGYELPKEQSLGKLSAKQHNTMAAEVILKDSATILLKGFEYSAACPGSAYFVAGRTANAQPDQLTRLIYDNGKTSKLGSYNKKDITAILPIGRHWNEFKWFSVYCVDAKQSYAEIAINQAVAEKLPLHDPKAIMPLPSIESTDNAGAPFAPFSALCVFTLISVTFASALAIRRCLESDNRIKTC
ncbi:protein Skeletor, isoforms B/C-like [Dermacentor silvarum]|uniref:protein Skeletor, isoforms B/C-like n=1 Tax=Dermacentor silvarum TaxID=543639 RepID=UPI002101709D|nr:protein Skeletor, isoforms B/C-like [Dermacentor silvarum]